MLRRYKMLRMGTDEPVLESVAQAAALRKKAEDALLADQPVMFDFEGVTSMSGDFAEECFGRLLLTFPYEVVEARTGVADASPELQRLIEVVYLAWRVRTKQAPVTILAGQMTPEDDVDGKLRAMRAEWDRDFC